MDANLLRIKDEIERSAAIVGRDPASVTLIAVSKQQSIEAIRRLYDSGQRHFGESRLQEALPKIEALPPDIHWHFIGKLQSNKVRRTAELFGLIHTLETQSQLREFAKLSFGCDALIEVNIAKEPQKSGIFPEALDEYLQEVLNCPRIHFRGLMVIGPDVDDPEASRPYFRELKSLGDQIGAEAISMGMSRDFGVAIQEGATHVRVGTALFGGRD